MSTILVVDDASDVTLALRFILERAGHAVHVAEDGRAGLALVGEVSPDLVVLDVGMPVMDGWEMLAQLRAFSQVPVLMLTARHVASDRARGLRLGADDYVTKPFLKDELLERIERLLADRSVATAKGKA